MFLDTGVHVQAHFGYNTNVNGYLVHVLYAVKARATRYVGVSRCHVCLSQVLRVQRYVGCEGTTAVGKLTSVYGVKEIRIPRAIASILAHDEVRESRDRCKGVQIELDARVQVQ